MTKTHLPATLCKPEPHPTQGPSRSSLLPVQSTDLFKGQKTLVIEHNGSCYRLQSTKLGKLILTK